MHVAARFSGPGQPYDGLAKRGPVNWTGAIRLVPEKLREPLSWGKPCRVFVNSMSDLFHEDVPDEYIDRVFAVMAVANRHTFQVLTKRAGRMANYMGDPGLSGRIAAAIETSEWLWLYRSPEIHRIVCDRIRLGGLWPLPQVWLGVSCEDQARADERIPHLLRTPATVRFLSVEPLLDPVNLGLLGTLPKADFPGYQMVYDRLHWVIVGGESGRGARPCDVAWIESVVRQCEVAGVPCFVKQVGSLPFCTLRDANNPNYRGSMTLGYRDPKGGDPSEWAINLRVRQFPAVVPAAVAGQGSSSGPDAPAGGGAAGGGSGS